MCILISLVMAVRSQLSMEQAIALGYAYWLLTPVGLGVAGKTSSKQFAKHVAILRN